MTRDSKGKRRRQGEQRMDADRARQQRHNLRRWAAQQQAQPGQPPVDPVHVLRLHLRGTPRDAHLFVLARWSLAARLVEDTRSSDYSYDQVDDLGPVEVVLHRAVDPATVAPGDIGKAGFAYSGRWTSWYLGGTPPPVPG